MTHSSTPLVIPKYIYHSYAACKDPFTCRYPIHILEPITKERNTQSEPATESIDIPESKQAVTPTSTTSPTT